MSPPLAAALLLAAVAVTAPAPAAGAARVPPGPATPIEHVVVLMQENHSFDNYFGTYPGADGIPPGVCMPRDPVRPAAGCVRPFHLGDRAVADLAHSTRTFADQRRGARLDGFVSALADQGTDGSLAMGYYDDRELPYYWNVADEYVLFDRFFSSAGGGSVWNHMYWIAAVPGTADMREGIPPGGFGDIPTIFDRLEERGVSWRFYIQNYDPRITFRTPGDGDRASQIVWAPVLAFARFLDDPVLNAGIVDLAEYFADLERGTLPSVAFIVPSGSSEHPPGSIRSGASFVRTLITELMRSSAWPTSAFLWTYDDWGGWYDHVDPPQIDEYGYGFRVPALLVSPYARRGHVDSTELDYTSILRFIEDNWSLAPLAERDARANSIAPAFDFGQPARPPVLLPPSRDAPVRATTRIDRIYVAYGSLVALPLLLVLAAVVGARRRRPAAARRAA